MMSIKKTVIGAGMTVRDGVRVGVKDGVVPEVHQALSGLFAGAVDPRPKVRAICRKLAGGHSGIPEVDSEAWFAKEVLECLAQADGLSGEGQHDDAERWTFQAGLTIGIAAMKFEWEPVVITGAKVRLGGKAGHEKVHGTPAKKQDRWNDLQAQVTKARKNDPTVSKAEIRRVVSRKCGVSESTIRRRTLDPGKEKPAQSSQ